MRRIIQFNMVSVDGFFEGPAGIDWHNADDEFRAFADEQLKTVDTLLLGRATYGLLENYWKSNAANTHEPIVAGVMNSLPKIVVSNTMQKAEWNNTRVISTGVERELTELKKNPGKDIMMLGSAHLAETLIDQQLIDEFRLMVNPIALGMGKPIFKTTGKIELSLLKVRLFNSGNVLLIYKPIYK